MGYVNDVKCLNLRPSEAAQRDPLNFLTKTIGDFSDYSLGYLLSGTSILNKGSNLTIGDNYFIDSDIICDADKSDIECINKKKKTYIRNIPTGTVPGLNTSFNDLTGTNLEGLTEGRGIVPGMLEDIGDLNPYSLMLAMINDGNYGSNICKKMKLPVGKNIYDESKQNIDWKWQEECTGSYKNTVPTTDIDLNIAIGLKNNNMQIQRSDYTDRIGIPAPLGFSYVDKETFTNTYNKINVIKYLVILFFIIIILLFAFNYQKHILLNIINGNAYITRYRSSNN